MLTLEYKFNDSYYDYDILEDVIVEDIAEYFDRFHIVKLDGKASDVYKALNDLGVDFDELVYEGDIANFIKNKHKDEAKEAYEEEQLLYNELDPEEY